MIYFSPYTIKYNISLKSKVENINYKLVMPFIYPIHSHVYSYFYILYRLFFLSNNNFFLPTKFNLRSEKVIYFFKLNFVSKI